jgi:cysteine-rich repeat protein
VAGDGCSETMEVENGWACSGKPSVCETICGDGLRVIPEVCDDGNSENGDGCSTRCSEVNGANCRSKLDYYDEELPDDLEHHPFDTLCRSVVTKQISDSSIAGASAVLGVMIISNIL